MFKECDLNATLAYLVRKNFKKVLGQKNLIIVAFHS